MNGKTLEFRVSTLARAVEGHAAEGWRAGIGPGIHRPQSGGRMLLIFRKTTTEEPEMIAYAYDGSDPQQRSEDCARWIDRHLGTRLVQTAQDRAQRRSDARPRRRSEAAIWRRSRSGW